MIAGAFIVGSSLAWLTLLRDLSFKSLLFLLTAWVLTLGMRRASAAACHLVWLLTFAGLFCLPLLSVTLPKHAIPLLPRRAAVSFADAPNSVVSVGGADAKPPVLPSAPSPRFTHGRSAAVTKLPPLLCLLWLGGAVVTSVPLGVGWLLAARRICQCAVVTEPGVLALAAEAAGRVGVTRLVSLRRGSDVGVPVTLGLFRPVVLLPDEIAAGPSKRLYAALLHEFAHIRRGDWAVQTLARLVCAAYWYHPLVWAGWRRLRAEAERACDDMVLSTGLSAADYAQHLLSVAQALSRPHSLLPLAVPMAQRSALEARLRAILTARPYQALTRRAVVLFLLPALSVLLLLSMLRPVARAAHRPAARVMAARLPVHIVLPQAARLSSHPPVPKVIADLPVPIQPIQTGVSSMKPLTPLKTVALATLAAGLTLPAAHAKTPAPAPPKAPVSQKPMMPDVPSVNPFTSSAFSPANVPVVQTDTSGVRVSIDFSHHPVTDALLTLFRDSHRDYMIAPDVEGLVTLKLTNVPLEKALSFLAMANSQPLEWSIEDGVYHIRPRIGSKEIGSKEIGSKEAVTAPRQVQLKFEWASSASTPDMAPQKDLDALTFVAQDGHRSQVSSRHRRSGVEAQETISVLPRVEAGGVVVLDITEHSGSAANAGDTANNVTETIVRVKDGQTGMIGGLVLGSHPSGQSAQRMLFVTPTIIRSTD